MASPLPQLPPLLLPPLLAAPGPVLRTRAPSPTGPSQPSLASLPPPPPPPLPPPVSSVAALLRAAAPPPLRALNCFMLFRSERLRSVRPVVGRRGG